MDKKIYIHSGHNKHNKQLATNLRKNLTPEEKHLWYDFLAKFRPRFYRQRTIDGYIADFYCPKAKLVIEIDGSQHYSPEGKSHDQLRTRIIHHYGIDVIRFSNFDINTNFSGVCHTITNRVKDVERYQ